MLTVISGTNRVPSLTTDFSMLYKDMAVREGVQVNYLRLDKLPPEILSGSVYEKSEKPAAIVALQRDFFIPAQKFVFIFPEYNGSFPGILKLLIDSLDPGLAFKGKKAALIGISTGRAGNLRGLDHLASILLHMQMVVMPHLLPVSRVQDEMTGQAFTERTHQLVKAHLHRMLAF